MRRAVGVVLVAAWLFGCLSSVGGAREHILLSVDYGRSTVIEQAGQAVTGALAGIRQDDLTQASRQFAVFGDLVALLGQDLSDQTGSVRAEAFEVLGVILGQLQSSLITHADIWQDDRRLHAFVLGELTAIGDTASPMVFAGLQDNDDQVQLRSFLVVGVLLGGQADFRSVSLGPNFPGLVLVSSPELNQLHQQLSILKEYDKSSPRLAKWIEVLSAISDKVHDMIEAAAE